METFELLAKGFAVALQEQNILACLIGVIGGL